MDVKKVFRGISQKLFHDFQISSGIEHRGTKGTYRENALADFLSVGRLPKRFGVGSGEIVGPNGDVSKQSDLIIYDQLDGLSLLYDESVQVYPVECIYGVIEVKSSLSKTELIKSLENIKSVKSLVLNETITKTTDNLITVTFDRPKPFGIVFAYSLAANSLGSLTKNLNEWEESNSKEHWPNLIIVLEEGLLYHYGDGMRNQWLTSNNHLKQASGASYLAYGKDTLFHFYSTLIDLCNDTKLGPVNLHRYYDPVERMGNYLVKNHDGFRIGDEEQIYRIKYDTIKKIVDTCQQSSMITYKELLLKQFGQLPVPLDEDELITKVYHYDPENLPGMHEVSNPIEKKEGRAYATERMLVPYHSIEVDHVIYVFAQCYLEDSDLEPIAGKTINDL